MVNMRFKKSNKGMTLVELIVAIGIFVAAIIPMLYAFVYSTGYNFKSQKTQQATGIAQGVLENCKSLNFDFEDLRDRLDSSSSETILDGADFTVASEEGSNPTYWLRGVQANNNAESSNRRVYDVRIDITDLNDSITDYSSIQSMGHTTYNFGASLSSLLKSEDSVAQAKAIDAINDLFTDGNITCSTMTTAFRDSLPSGTLAACFSDSDIRVSDIVLDREIMITVSNHDTYTVGSDKQSVQVIVNYYLSSNGSNPSVFHIQHDATIGANTYALKIDKPLGSDYTYTTHTTPIHSVNFGEYYTFNEPASAVYFYYYPGFDSFDGNTATYKDHFKITNNMTENASDHSGASTVSKLDFYLFRQYDRDLYTASPTVYDNRIENYSCDINMETTGHKTYLYHNLRWKIVEDVTHTPHIFKLVDLVSPGVAFSSASGCVNCTVNDPVYATYGSSYKKYNNASDPVADNGLSHVLSNYPVLPYYHLGYPDPVNQLFPTRMRVTVRVYSQGHTSAGEEIETMTCEMLNW